MQEFFFSLGIPTSEMLFFTTRVAEILGIVFLAYKEKIFDLWRVMGDLLPDCIGIATKARAVSSLVDQLTRAMCSHDNVNTVFNLDLYSYRVVRHC
ncbi:hypothetical protein ElyMa_001717200 [Elysia marginata]|uniref:Uncharacterized protein n=1 Tax=Elysia marginata TaxID=1093978 RepID=A0AAV4JZP5_9GAST|nr:hypothetical protein ElyMa_001717200 [Elysia marginata]